jgi:pyruvate ferredoxin oxidoreductase alpha subunit
VPVLVNLDGFFLSFTREPVEIPDPEQVRAFLPPFGAVYPVFRATQPVAHGVAVLDGATYSYFRYQLHYAVENALGVHADVADEFARVFGRRYSVLEQYRTDDADVILVMVGAFATKGKAAVNRARSRGQRVGLVRLRMIRPLPRRLLAAVLAGRRSVGVVDQNISPGLGGILFHEIAGALAAAGVRPPVLRSFIGGLGGKEISPAELDHAIGRLVDGEETELAEEQLFMTGDEWQHVKSRLAMAGKAVAETVK